MISDDDRLAAELAAEAGRRLRELRADGGDPAALRREGDRRSHEFLTAELARLRRGDAVLSEEGSDDAARLSASRVWIVDPLDGTREFGEAGRTDWAVHVALWQRVDLATWPGDAPGEPMPAGWRGQLAAGAVALPADGQTFSTLRTGSAGAFADRSGSAFADRSGSAGAFADRRGSVPASADRRGSVPNSAERRGSAAASEEPTGSAPASARHRWPTGVAMGPSVAHRRSDEADGEAKVRLVVSRTRPPVFVRGLAAEIGADLIPLGSAGAKIISVLTGAADAYVHAGGQYEWDSAAPVAVAQAAGLHASRIDGRPLAYNQPDPWMPDILICPVPLAGMLLAAIRAARQAGGSEAMSEPTG